MPLDEGGSNWHSCHAEPQAGGAAPAFWATAGRGVEARSSEVDARSFDWASLQEGAWVLAPSFAPLRSEGKASETNAQTQVMTRENIEQRLDVSA